MIDLEIDKILKIVVEQGYRRVALQLPEGLKDRATELAERITSDTGSEALIFADPCYGACDLADKTAVELGCDALFHFGHSKVLSNFKLPVHYIEVKLRRDPLLLLSKNLDKLPRRIGLISTVQHIHELDSVKSYLEKEGLKVLIGNAGGRAAHRGQVLGCSFEVAKKIARDVEGFLYIGTGDFHPLGVALSTGKRIFALDVERGELRDMEDLKEKILRKRFGGIARSKDAESFGIIVGEKAGQRRMELARRIKRLIEKHGRRAYFIALREVSSEVLIPYRDIDVFVNTACPRISIDDAERYKKPLLTPVELEIVLEERDWEEYSMDEIGNDNR